MLARGGNGAGGHADGELVEAHIGGGGSGQADDLGSENESVAVHGHGEGGSAGDGGGGTDAVVGDGGRDGDDREIDGIGYGDAGRRDGDGGYAFGGDQVYRYDGGQLGGADEGGGERGTEIDPENGGALNEALAGDGQGDGRSAGHRGCRAEVVMVVPNGLAVTMNLRELEADAAPGFFTEMP